VALARAVCYTWHRRLTSWPRALALARWQTFFVATDDDNAYHRSRFSGVNWANERTIWHSGPRHSVYGRTERPFPEMTIVNWCLLKCMLRWPAQSIRYRLQDDDRCRCPITRLITVSRTSHLTVVFSAEQSFHSIDYAY